MRRFADLYRSLDATRKTKVKEAALVDYFRTAPSVDAAWALHYLLGRKGRRVVSSRLLRAWTAEVSGYPEWLVEESYDAVGDLAETISLLVPKTVHGAEELALSRVIEERIEPLAKLDEDERRSIVLETLSRLGQLERMLYAKLITGGFRVGVSRGLVSRALAIVAGTDAASMAHRLIGRWEPNPAAFERLIAATDEGGDPLRPYPFFLAHSAPTDVSDLGSRAEFQAEWKWDGIRSQVVRRGDVHLIWSRGEDLVDDGFPEISAAVAGLPQGTVLDGELLAWSGDCPLDFHQLQRRIQRKTLSAKVQREVPVRLMVYDLLEHGGEDIRELPLEERRARLIQVVSELGSDLVHVAEEVPGDSWEALAELRESSRERRVEGLMLKRVGSGYGVGRKRGDWWKWKVDPFHIDAVLLYAQRGSGRRASLYTDYTFACWDEGNLVPVAKAYSGLTDAEIRRVDNFVRRNITESFGPVRAVTPQLVFELAFEGIQPSTRHKSGIALRFPRMARWREDKLAKDADTLDTLKDLMPACDESGGNP